MKDAKPMQRLLSASRPDRPLRGAPRAGARRLPSIDYARHPAYDGFGRPTARARVSALVRFLRGALIVALRRLADYEHMPKPPSGTKRRRWFARNAPLYALLVPRAWWRRVRGAEIVPDSATGRAALARLSGEGVLAFPFEAGDREAIASLMAPHFATLEQRLSAIPDERLRFEDNRLWLDRKQHEDLYAAIEAVLDRHGIIEAASAYLRRRVGLAHVIAQLNTSRTDFWTGQFTDAGVPDPGCNYFHVDTAFGILKGLIYMNEVGPDTGPFSYVAGSQRRRRGRLDGFIRRANDYAGLSSTAPGGRRSFMALPIFLRRKCAFGPDVEDTHPDAGALLAGERVFTSGLGDAVIFDPEGVHRGGMVKAGARRALSIHLADLA
jgi:hypothetical protein